MVCGNKNRLVAGFNALVDLARRAGTREVERKAAAAGLRLEQNRLFLVVLGLFKRGKSTCWTAW